MPSKGLKQLKSGCPRCGCPKERIEHWNCGPIRYLKCPDCNYILKESDVITGKLFDAWNEQRS